MDFREISQIRRIKSYPSVTVTLPTHRTSPENKQDPIRLKKMIKQATERLLKDSPKRDIEALIARIEKLAETVDYRHTLDGLVLFANKEFAKVYTLPFPLKERVVVNETFFTRDLVYAITRTPRYWTLVLTEKPARLFMGVREQLTEITTGGFPMVHEGAGGEEPLPDGRGINKSAYRDEKHRQFFRQVDSALKPFMAENPLPLVVVGVDRYLSFFQEVSEHTSSILTTLTGSHDTTSAHELGNLVWPLVDKSLALERKKISGELEKALGEKKCAVTIEKVWTHAKEGRGRILLVEEDFHYPARVDETGNIVAVPPEEIDYPNVMDDAVDEIIHNVLETQGKVVFMDNGSLADYGRIALILRY